MSELDSYIEKATGALRDGNADLIDEVCRNTISVFNLSCINPEHYKVISHGAGSLRYSANDLEKVISKLKMMREEKDRELYESYGLMSFTDSIRQLEDALTDGCNEQRLEQLYNEIDHIYANTLDAYTDGLCGWEYCDDKPGDDQTRMRIKKLCFYRDLELRKIRLAESQAGRIAVTQNQTQETNAAVTSIAIVDVLEACKQVDTLPEDSLSDADKAFFKELLFELEAAASKNKQEGEKKFTAIREFLADKGMDVLIAAGPYILTVLRNIVALG